MAQDLTKGTPWKVLLTFALPMIISVSFQQFYSIADSMIAGKFVGKEALAAVSASFPVTMIYLAIGTGSGVGCSVVVSQIFGAGEYKKARSAVLTALISVAVLAAAVTLTGVFTSEFFMRLLKTPEDVFKDAALYLDVYVYGIFFLFLYNAISAIFQSLGNSRLPLYFLIFSSVFNIGMDLLFVLVFRMGVAGVAWATFLSQGIAAAVSGAFLIAELKKIGGKLTLKEVFRDTPVFDARLLRRMAVLAIPSILQSSVVSVGQLFVQSKVNSFGSDVMAGFGGAFKINLFVINLFLAVSNAIGNFTAQNVGAHDLKRIKEGVRWGLVFVYVLAVASIAVLLGAGKYLMRLFVDDAPEVIAVGWDFMLIVTPFYLVGCLKIGLDGIFKGTGDVISFTSGTLLDLIVRVAMSFVLSDLMQSEKGIWWAWPIGWSSACLLTVIWYFWGRWKRTAHLVPKKEKVCG